MEQVFMELISWGAAQRVTGSKHLLKTAKGHQVLLDCGLFQGIGTTPLNQSFGFDPAEVDAVLLSHAHIDHTGLLPRLVKKGFNGPIYSTPATKSLCEIMLLDSAMIQERDLARVNERRKKRNEPVLEELYDVQDVQKTLKLFKTVAYHHAFSLFDELTIRYFEAGHILGSAGIHIEWRNQQAQKKSLFFTGDIGRAGDKILRSPEPFPPSHYILMESTYGNRLHTPAPDLEGNLLQIVRETCVERGGKVIIPAFAVDRTQELVYALDRLHHAGLLPPIPVFVDSPLSVKATSVVRKHEEEYNQDMTEYIRRDGDAFGFDQLTYVTEVEDSKALNHINRPCVIISSSGMAEAGRVKHHIANQVGNPDNTILMVGYCSPNTLGHQLKSGAEIVRIFGEDFPVRAKIKSLEGFSAHADYEEMLAYLGCQNPKDVQTVFLVHGEVEAQTFFKEKLHEAGFSQVEIPVQGQSFLL